MATQRSSGYWATGNGRVSFRHQKKAHTLYLDGHAKPEGQELLYKAHKAGFPWNVTLKATKSWEDTTAAAWTDDRYDPYR